MILGFLSILGFSDYIGRANSAVRPVLQQLHCLGWGDLVISYTVKDLLNSGMRSLFPPLAGVFLHSLKYIFGDVVQRDLVSFLPLSKKSPGIGRPASSLIHPNISFTVEYGDQVAQCERASLFVKHDIQQ
jgi:hypothetical protein